MSYMHRRTLKKRTGSAELMCLLVVLAAGFATAWWAGQRIGLDLSSVTTVASVLGLTETGYLLHGQTGYHPTAEVRTTQPAAAPNCAADQAPSFADYVGPLEEQLGTALGVPV